MTKENQKYTGAQFSDALLRRQISTKNFARNIGVTSSTISKWCKGGVPVKHEHVVKQVLDATELQEYGAHHQDLMPETIKGEL